MRNVRICVALGHLPASQVCELKKLYLADIWSLTERQQSVCELSKQHLAIFSLVVQLQTFQEVLIAACVLVLLDLSKDGQELLNLQFLLILLLGSTHLLYNSLCRVEVQAPQDVPQVDGINSAAAIEVIDGEGKVSPYK